MASSTPSADYLWIHTARDSQTVDRDDFEGFYVATDREAHISKFLCTDRNARRVCSNDLVALKIYLEISFKFNNLKFKIKKKLLKKLENSRFLKFNFQKFVPFSALFQVETFNYNFASRNYRFTHSNLFIFLFLFALTHKLQIIFTLKTKNILFSRSFSSSRSYSYSVH